MSVQAQNIESHATHAAHSYAARLATNRLGLWLFIISDSFVFGGLMVARFYLLEIGRAHV